MKKFAVQASHNFSLYMPETVVQTQIHCKYFGCIQYSFWQCYVCHSSVAVVNAVDDSTKSMAVLNLKYS